MATFLENPKTQHSKFLLTLNAIFERQTTKVQNNLCGVTIICIYFCFIILMTSALHFSLDVFNRLLCRFPLCRFGKKKDEKKEAKAAQQKSDLLSDHELQRMKDERERWACVCVWWVELRCHHVCEPSTFLTAARFVYSHSALCVIMKNVVNLFYFLPGLFILPVLNTSETLYQRPVSLSGSVAPIFFILKVMCCFLVFI